MSTGPRQTSRNPHENMDWEEEDDEALPPLSTHTPPPHVRMNHVRPPSGSGSRHARLAHHSQKSIPKVLHDAYTSTTPMHHSSRNKCMQTILPSSPRKRQQLNDHSIIEESDEIQYSFEDTDLVETVSEENAGFYEPK